MTKIQLKQSMPTRTLGSRLATAIRKERRRISRIPLRLSSSAEMSALLEAAAPVQVIYDEIQRDAGASKPTRALAEAWYDGKVSTPDSRRGARPRS